MKTKKCNYCKGKGYLEVKFRSKFIFLAETLKKPYKVYCPVCYGKGVIPK